MVIPVRQPYRSFVNYMGEQLIRFEQGQTRLNPLDPTVVWTYGEIWLKTFKDAGAAEIYEYGDKIAKAQPAIANGTAPGMNWNGQAQYDQDDQQAEEEEWY